MTTSALLQPLLPAELWNERLFTGQWQAGQAPTTAVLEPPTGNAVVLKPHPPSAAGSALSRLRATP
ncbi:hypothetical protein [Pseudomonas fluorescens]|uniref:hypothetical protein n=1 Tax=Pseudomonas fluorescens TaxID=294 RepID=UPI001783BF30|nr:hypothetical protein [Pseudomonas fluorescens]